MATVAPTSTLACSTAENPWTDRPERVNAQERPLMQQEEFDRCWRAFHEQIWSWALLPMKGADQTLYQPSCTEATTGVTPRIEIALHEVSDLRVLIPRPSDIRAYLLRFPDMVGAVPPVCRAAKRRFPSDTQLSLELYRDPEIEDEYLTVYVRQKRYDERIMDRIEAVWAECEGAIAGKLGWILVTTDFQPPR